MRTVIKSSKLTALSIFSFEAFAAQCESAGPQTPRDIDSLQGHNKRVFAMAPPKEKLNLCNIHFHKNAEHKAKDFSVVSNDPKYGGFRCNATASLTPAELAPVDDKVCNNVKPGDTIEVHWVHSSCDVKPGPTLGACLNDSCANPDLRVETQVFLVVNDENAQDFTELDYQGQVGGYHQAGALPSNTGTPVEFLGSTTGPSYNNQQCSPLQVSWSVRPSCAKVDINSLARWCKDNAFEEDHAHGIRKLVTDPQLLSPITH
ncbi:delta-class carbonic anhydrase [Pseudoalteromonas sp. OANN1]|uniref:delta-class carbonic anhydrase n=1 Tax=Pseudoalteromonas sp. OANN1 TaxID=2954497 RepID=UPI00209867A7|nr:delta-class carbonic anhydrase [Pseudoalteromonas sp. OANN1]MCO7199624.1 delta-class carbonic anhydrase [Pseudoalteromonas sp. OANN1]